MVPKEYGPKRCSSTKYLPSGTWVISVTHLVGIQEWELQYIV